MNDGSGGGSNQTAISGDPLTVLATLAVISDAVTTTAFLSAGVGTERNGLLLAGLEYGVPGGAFVFVATPGLLLAVTWLPLGAVSTYVAAYLVVTMGLGGGLNNAYLLLTGESWLAPLGLPWGYLSPPVLATIAGFGAVKRSHDDPNWLVITAVGGILLGGEVVSFTI